jgi:hypothetical protein
MCQGAPVIPYDKPVILAIYPHSMFQWIFSMQNAVRSSKECMPNAPSTRDSSTFVPSLSGLDVSSVCVPTCDHKTCILKGDKKWDICKHIKTLIGHNMWRWQLQNKIYCKVTYLTLEFWCQVQGTYHAMIRTLPKSSSHPCSQCGRRSLHRSMQSWHHFTPTSRAEGGAMVVWYVWCFMCIQGCYGDGSWGHISIHNLYIHIKLRSILFLVNKDLFSFIMQVIFASIRFIIPYHQSWIMKHALQPPQY